MRPWLKDPDSMKVPERSETLRDWLLPMMAKSLDADEKERKALALLESTKAIKAKFEK